MNAWKSLMSLVVFGSLAAAAPARADAAARPPSGDDPCLNVPGACGETVAGEKIAFVSDRDGNPEIYSVNLDGTGVTRLTNAPGSDDEPAWSPDGQRIAFSSDRTGFPEVYVMNANGSNVVRRTFSGWHSGSPAWTPDGTSITYSALSNGSLNLWVVSADAGGPPPRLFFEAPGWDSEPAWAPDGTRLVLVSDWYAYDFVWDIYLLQADGTGFAGLTGHIFDQVDYFRPSWSPDGTKLALAITRRVGTNDYLASVGVMDSNGDNLTPLIPAVPFTTSSWSPDGQRIAYTSGSGGARDVSWVFADGSASGPIVSNGWNPSWRR